MTTQPKPFISVVLPAYNGAATIGRALDSLLGQDYPKDRYEIIVVNDGSTDGTAQVVAARKVVRYVGLPHNMGIPSAQNAGLKAAKGDIYVNFNDDCQAAPDFLSQLAKGYAELDKPAGIGGVVIKQAAGHVKGLVANYIEACGSGTPPKTTGIGPTFLPAAARRLLTYLFGNYATKKQESPSGRGYDEVVELYGANASFPMSMLREVGGWDVSMAAPVIGGIEDRDICFRLRQRFPDYRFYAIHSARVMLEQDPEDTAVSIRRYLLRQYRRGPFNYIFHAKNGLTPPIFPFPILIDLALLATLPFAPLLAMFELLVLPLLCYGWWVQRALRERRVLYVVLPYFQMVEETMVLAGLARGFIVHNRMKHATR